MKIQLLYNKLLLNKNNINPKYIPRKGIIIDTDSGKTIYKLPELEMTEFFYFKLVFDSHKLNTYYDPKTNTCAKKVCGRSYKLVLYLDITAIILNGKYSFQLYKKLQLYLLSVQTTQLKTTNNYHINEKWIGQFILYREEFPMYLIPWNYFRINNNIAFDLKNKKIVHSKQISRINFNRRGGIIETNNVEKLVRENFLNKICPKKTIVILPKHMVGLWKDVHKITFDEILTPVKEKLASIKKFGINQVIIHECHTQLLIEIKKIICALDCKIVWIINSLPLRYYFSSEKTPNKLKINDLATITNLWMNFSTHDKRKYKTEIIRLLFTKFSQYYSIINYEDMTLNKLFGSKKVLELHSLEKNILQELHKYYHNWKDKLTNDEKNIYSIATQEKIHLIENKLFDALLLLISRVKFSADIKIFFRGIISQTLVKMESVEKNIDKLINSYTNASKLSYKIMDRDIVDFDNILSDLNDKKERINCISENYKRYFNNNINTHNYEECPVCYSQDKTIKSQLVCGHCLCLDCLIGTIASIKRCPVCSEYITLQKVVILGETMPNYNSNIINFFDTINKRKTILLTNLRALDNMSCNNNYKMSIIDITKPNISHKLGKIEKVNRIFVLMSPHILSNKSSEEISKIISHINLLNNDAKIIKIEIILH